MDSDSDDDVRENVVDIGTFMEHYNYIGGKLWPLAPLVRRVERIRRWENYPLSLVVVAVTCVLALFPRVLLAALSAVLFFVVLAGNRHFPKSKHKRPQIPPDVIPQLIDEDKESLRATAAAQKSRQQALKNYRQIIKSADNVLVYVGTILDGVKSIFTWDNDRTSTCVSIVLLVLVVALMWVPVSAIFSLLLGVFFCWNESFLLQTNRSFVRFKCYLSRNPLPSQSPQAGSLQFSENMQQQHSCTLQSHSPSPPPLNGSQAREDLSTSADSATGGTRGSPNIRDKSMCHKCGAAFNLLKRKHPCNNCGHLFCSSCTVKVTRAALGATSPAAFQETVRVCQECKSELESNQQTADTAQVSSNS